MPDTIDGWNPRDDVVGVLNLVNIHTEDGEFGFLLAQDGVFVDVNGKHWYGSTLLSSPKLQSAIDGVAPAGEISVSFFQQPDAPDLVDQMLSLGVDYVNGHKIEFYLQPICSMAEFSAPTIAPQLELTRTMRKLSYRASGAEDRSIGLSFEPWSEERRAARRITLNTDGHAKLLGAANPSLEYMPTQDFEEEKLFG
ncbi:hypothetical protein [Shimia sp.]|uniref:hypothetical protein n=1 Tax=Shimia sp. TaxID=1954381 RepID=UPI003B8D5C73